MPFLVQGSRIPCSVIDKNVTTSFRILFRNNRTKRIGSWNKWEEFLLKILESVWQRCLVAHLWPSLKRSKVINSFKTTNTTALPGQTLCIYSPKWFTQVWGHLVFWAVHDFPELQRGDSVACVTTFVSFVRWYFLCVWPSLSFWKSFQMWGAFIPYKKRK